MGIYGSIDLSQVVDPTIKFRLLIVKLYQEGNSGTEIARLLDLKKSKVYFWIKRFTTEGVEGLADRPRSGRPGKIDRRQLKKALLHPPIASGINNSEWSIATIQDLLLKWYGRQYSSSYIYTLLKELNISITCRCAKQQFQSKSMSISPLHLEVMADASEMIDAPIHRIITESGIKPVLKIQSQTRDRTVLSGETENGVLTLIYEEGV